MCDHLLCVRPHQVYAGHFVDESGRPYISSNGRPPQGAPHLLGTTKEIEDLRPKSPPANG
jgi:hypothetical protein